ncbi:DASH family cryptochrome [Fulvivirga kasyanovii]|uniref:Cryptochrome DASH n=1 Tax=Fulvivirga kasyanovii TaxID=396812 RepID=A0ABW9S0I8_9BACT|nr:DASH family cryptochrome [Fulvivirga kasyanovii]MTI29025.1 DASH family cryptochrome [Fulvivirga kasyanovii]
MKNVIVWFTNDLRLYDNEALSKAIQNGDKIYPLYIFDPAQFKETHLGFAKTGAFRAKFLIECVENLRNNLQKIGSDLIVRTGHAADIISELVEKSNINAVYASKDVTHEELQRLDEVEQVLLKKLIPLELYWQQTLFHEEDVPWPIKQVPDVFTTFRKEAEANNVEVRPLFPAPKSLSPIENIKPGPIPTMQELGMSPEKADRRRVLNFKGGETEAWKRLHKYFWKQDLLRYYKETRNEMIGSDYSSKLSPWLATGAISAKSIYWEIKKYEDERVKNDSTYWFFFELLWRDFFKFMAKKNGSKIFHINGFQDIKLKMEDNLFNFEKWRTGNTGEPFVDANMKELLLTGYMSNRGRQNAASYLMYDLNVNWTWGAMWFENRLIDYDACSNWLNWAYIAGVGNDPRQGRKFIIENQSLTYDPDGKYVDLWLNDQ